ncbi:MAG: efflux system, outer rane lipoprotein CmeC [Myxococcales bacterium]|nr:efflux system, outer rane lipoprotein CmeC [Myxococcales bacterium]
MKKALAFLALLVAGCALGPNYKRPWVPMTATFRGQPTAEAASFADLPWWEVFRDRELAILLREALANSYDLKDAIARVAVARQNARISTDALLPSISVDGGPSYQQVFSPFTGLPGVPGGNFRYSAYVAEARLSWELDLWGRLRRLRQSAFADFLASEDNRRGVIVSLIGDVAQGYFNLQSLDLQLEVARRTVVSRGQTLDLFVKREVGGVGDHLETSSQQASLAQAQGTVPNLERQIAQAENQLSVLIGRPPGSIARTRQFLPAAAPPPQPLGLPGALLERRPDVRSAEARMISANAQVGAAFAALFPSLTVTANGGVESASLVTLFTTGALTFGVGLVVNWLAPLFNGAANAHRYRAQQAGFDVAVADYRRTVLGALGDVANAQVQIKKLGEVRVALEAEVAARIESVRLAKVRFGNGVASYLDVVQAEQNLFGSELSLAQTIGAQFVGWTQLYRALGGGWELPAPAPAAARDRESRAGR